MTPILLALFGYAIGTAQILALDWFRRRTSHAQHLRLLRSELIRNSYFCSQFNLPLEGELPDEYNTPRVPPLAAGFQTPLAQVDFYLTDEHNDDNTQRGLMGLIDLATLLQDYREAIDKSVEKHHDSSDAITREAHEEWIKVASKKYDEVASTFHASLLAAIADVERRQRVIGLWSQVNRPLGALPPGKAPPPTIVASLHGDSGSRAPNGG